MIKYIKLSIGIVLIVLLSACSFGGDTFKPTSYVIAGDTVYYRVYNNDDVCLDEGIVEIEPMDPELVFVFQNEDEFVYRMAIVTPMTNCESNLYVKHDGDYIWVSLAYEQGLYTLDELLIAFDHFDHSWMATEGPETVAPNAFDERLYISDKGQLIWEADNIDYATDGYCTHNECTDGQELTKADLEDYFYDQVVDFSKYDVTNDTVIAIYHITGTGENTVVTVQIFLERIGTGEWEFPNGAIWENHLNISHLVIDDD